MSNTPRLRGACRLVIVVVAVVVLLLAIPVAMLALPFVILMGFASSRPRKKVSSFSFEKISFLRENKEGDTTILLNDKIDNSKWYTELAGSQLRLWSDVRYSGEGYGGPDFLFFYLKDGPSGGTCVVNISDDDFTLLNAPAHAWSQYSLERASRDTGV